VALYLLPYLASAGSTEAPEKDFCGSTSLCTLVTIDP
jgi:hypothetical protein